MPILSRGPSVFLLNISFSWVSRSSLLYCFLFWNDSGEGKSQSFLLVSLDNVYLGVLLWGMDSESLESTGGSSHSYGRRCDQGGTCIRGCFQFIIGSCVNLIILTILF